MPFFSIILVCFNSEASIDGALRSICSQDTDDYELIVIDGGSQDATLNILDSYKHIVTELVSEADKGIYDALNKGILRASGDVVAIIHSDDLFFNNGTLSFVNKFFLDRPKALIAFGDLHFFKDERCIRIWRPSNYSWFKLMLGWIVPHPACYIKRSVYNDIGFFDSDYRISGDYDYLLRVFKSYGHASYYMGRAVYKMRLGGVSTSSSNFFIKLKEDSRVMQKNGLPVPISILGKKVSKILQFKCFNS